jgi:hypothetical protein
MKVLYAVIIQVEFYKALQIGNLRRKSFQTIGGHHHWESYKSFGFRKIHFSKAVNSPI